STLDKSVLKEQTIWMFKQSESNPSDRLSKAETGEFTFCSLLLIIFSASSITKIEFGLSIKTESRAGLVMLLAIFGGKKITFVFIFIEPFGNNFMYRKKIIIVIFCNVQFLFCDFHRFCIYTKSRIYK